ncbi:MAG TPA: hypothetical protein VLT33_07210, partial [Labilithrix sp.]|nr:hypothetical protein [Labilithrix sp.]
MRATSSLVVAAALLALGLSAACGSAAGDDVPGPGAAREAGPDAGGAPADGVDAPETAPPP